MSLLKRTYALPQDTIEQFERTVSTGKRSNAVARLMREWLDKKQREQLRREVIEGCREMAVEYLTIEKEFHPAEEEIHRALDARPKKRRHRTGPA